MAMPILLVLIDAATVAVPAAAACDARDTTEIVVCGRQHADPDRYRLPRQESAASAGPPRAEWGLGHGVRAGVSVSQVQMPQGAVSQRAMATVKIPF